MTPLVVAVAAVLLSLERVCYVYAWRRPESFRRAAARVGLARDGVAALERAFYAFKAIQCSVFAYWCVHFAGSEPLALARPVAAVATGVVLVVVGQLLVLAAMQRLGRVGVFYGVRFGRRVPRCSRFPYSFLDHPQYVGAVATIWGLFLTLRFPHSDWFVLPAIETLFYWLGALFERDRDVRGADARPERVARFGAIGDD